MDLIDKGVFISTLYVRMSDIHTRYSMTSSPSVELESYLEPSDHGTILVYSYYKINVKKFKTHIYIPDLNYDI